MTTTPLPNNSMREGTAGGGTDNGDSSDLPTAMGVLQTALSYSGDSGTPVDLSVASESLQAELTCPACNKPFDLPTEENVRDKRPRVLPCLHTICGECLESLAKEDVKKKSIKCPRCPEKTLCCPGCNKGVGYAPKNPEVLRCPVCRREALIPGGTVLGFKTNLRLMKLLQMVKLRGEYKEGNVQCVGCAEPAKVHCIECQENYCQRHADFHDRSRATCDHHLVVIEDILESHQAFQMLHKRHYCLSHPKELVSLFCTDCEKAVCPRCAIGFHKSCDVTSIEEVYEHIKVKMEELKKKTESKIYSLKQSIVKIKNAERESDVESLTAKRKIQEMTERCINFLKERELELVKQVNQRCSANDDVMKIQLTQIEENLTNLKEGQDFIASAFANWTEAEIVAIEDQMMGKLEELAEIETHKYTYPVSRTEFINEGLLELTDVIKDLGSVISEERVKQAISALGLVSRENTRSGVEVLRTSAVPPSREA